MQAFIQANLNTDISRILLSKSPYPDVSSQELAGQIDSRKRCEKKLPQWYSTPGIYFPPKISIEQASSEVAARFKATLVTGSTLLDLTGGFGVDSYCFEKAGMKVSHAERNAELSEIAKHNAGVLKANRIAFYQGDGFDLLKPGISFDTIYVDPSRRVNTQKVFKLKDCEPDVPANLDFLLSKCSRLIIKTSPLLDLQAGIKELGKVDKIYIVSVKNDCKELLWVIDSDKSENEPEIICRSFNDGEQEYRFKISEERFETLSEYSPPLQYLYEPDVAVLKGGAFKLLCRDYHVLKLHQHSHLYTSEILEKNFPGRSFLVHGFGEYKHFMKANRLQKANIITRNFPLSPPEIKKKHHVTDGGEDFLLFTTGPSGQLMTIHTRKV